MPKSNVTDNSCYQTVKKFVDEHSPKAQALYEDLQQRRAFSHFGNFGNELLLPLKRLQKVSQKKFLDELKATATLQPSDPEAGFNLWNALTFWIGVLLEVRPLERSRPHARHTTEPGRYAV
mgnify:CR=1 FL=1